MELSPTCGKRYVLWASILSLNVISDVGLSRRNLQTSPSLVRNNRAPKVAEARSGQARSQPHLRSGPESPQVRRP